MSMRTCCSSDDHKKHDDDCPRKLELERRWKEKQKDVRSSHLRQKPDHENSKRGDRKREGSSFSRG